MSQSRRAQPKMSGIISARTSRSPRIEFQFNTQSRFRNNLGFSLFVPEVGIHSRCSTTATEVTSLGILSAIGPGREMDRWCGHFYYTAAVKEELRQKEGPDVSIEAQRVQALG